VSRAPLNNALDARGHAVPSQATNEATRREWRDLGFFYDRDDARRKWRIVGSRNGLLAFARLLQRYASNPRNEGLSEHDHFGPYMYLKIGTSNVPEITDDWIAGTQQDLLHLSSIVEGKLRDAKQGDQIALRDTYAPTSPYELVLEVCEDGFDPVRADEQLANDV
jgi:hypothetical protein